MAATATATATGPPSHVLHHATTVTSTQYAAVSAMETDADAATRWLSKAVEATRRQILESAGIDPTEAEHDDKRRRVGSLGHPGGTRSVADEAVVAGLGRSSAAAAKKEDAPAETDPNPGGDENTKPAAASKKNAKKGKKAAASKKKKATAGKKKAADADAPAAPPTLDVYSLKVAQLRAELRSRGMDASGLKRDLQARLAERIEEERRELNGAEEEESTEESTEENDDDDDEMYVEESGEEMVIKAAAVSSEQMAAASDFPGVDVQALSAKKESKRREKEEKAAAANEDEDDASIGYDDAMEVDTTAAVPPTGTAKDQEEEEEEDVDMEDAPSTTSATTATAKASTNRVTTSDGQGLKHDDTASASSSSVSPKKKGIKKMLQATANLFSPSKKNGGGKSPKASSAEHSPSEISDMLVSPIRPDTNGPTTNAAATASSAIAPPSETKVKEASSYFSQFTADQAAAATAPPPSKVGSALKTPAVRSGLASTAASASGTASAKTISSVGSKGSAISASSSLQTGDSSTASKYTSIKSQHRLKELQDNAAARKARLAELRAKSKPVTVAKTDGGSGSLTVAAAPLASAAKAKGLSTVEKQKEEKRKLLAAQMREKHFAETAAAKKQEETADVTTATTKPEAASATKTAAAAPVIPAMSSTPSQPVQQANQQQPHSQKQQQQQQRVKSKTPPQQKTTRPDIMSPMDTYEMSDREEDSSDYDSEEEAKPKKRIPRWARKENLIPALERQFLDGPHRMDPDSIFAEVSTCDLESIFANKKARYKKRTSSANWAKDKVSAAEKLVYSRAMGFGGKSKSNQR